MLLEDNKIEITELQIRSWILNYKEIVLEPILHGSDEDKSNKSEKSHISQTITDYKEYHLSL